MSRKWRRIAEGKPEPVPQSTLDALKRRRNRRLLFVGLLAISFPILEVIAYQFRAITITIDNRTGGPITDLAVEYPGGSFEIPEIKPEGDATRVIRPDYSFQSNQFSTYLLTIRFHTSDGIVFRQTGRIGALDYSATEKYVIEKVPTSVQLQLQHTTAPGFPLGTIRDLLKGLGLG
ncbi:hypothetical protein P12x_003498 [Tundrisphaera lichenicola]|uniref:hypothetical protein n=1 Tax=Tundrisphaera lichenicola TaxID=2029860 RepID=UPI003EBDB629